ncbi:MAG TPA: DUF86 domain-containing protein [Saprospiraceae bacterium]|nr:DUF86 domain-containing protein [Saprospiraceae bacterium]
MINKNLIYVLTILESIEKIKIYTIKFKDADEFYNSEDQLQFNAVLKLISVIGEESNKIESDFLQNNSKVNWRAIKDMRNRIVHDYRGIDQFIVFSIVKENLDAIKVELMNLFDHLKIELSNDDLNEILSSHYYRHLSYLL